MDKLENPSAKETDAELVQLIEDMGCLCGIPSCKGHEDLGGFVLSTPPRK